MANYVSLYCRRDKIASRTKSRFEEDDIENIQRNIDSKINSSIRARVGNFDKNGYRIILPLSGTTELIDDYSKTYQYPIDDDIKGIADDYVIAILEHDFSENDSRLEGAKESLDVYVTEHFGSLSSDDLDFTSDFLRTPKIIGTDGKYIKIIGGNKILAAIPKQTSSNIISSTTNVILN